MTPSYRHLYTAILPIRWADLDAYNHVNHAQYAIYMQEARIAWLEEVGIPLDKQPVVFPIVDLHIVYKKPLLFPGNVQVQLFTEQPQGRKWKIHHILSHSDDVTVECATGAIIAVCVDRATQKVVNIPEEFYQKLWASEA